MSRLMSFQKLKNYQIFISEIKNVLTHPIFGKNAELLNHYLKIGIAEKEISGQWNLYLQDKEEYRFGNLKIHELDYVPEAVSQVIIEYHNKTIKDDSLKISWDKEIKPGLKSLLNFY